MGRYSQQIINIHRRFLPALAGGAPYRQAYKCGVKMIGATSHYVTDQLDAGTIMDLFRKGCDLERMVLARAVRLHVEDRILVSPNKMVAFECRTWAVRLRGAYLNMLKVSSLGVKSAANATAEKPTHSEPTQLTPVGAVPIH